MKEYALTINLKDDSEKIEQYKAYHRAIWPEVLDCLKKVGITKMDIYLLGRRMFMIMEATDEFEPERDFERLDAEDMGRSLLVFSRRACYSSASSWWNSIR